MRSPDASTCPNGGADLADPHTCAFSIRLSAPSTRPDAAPEGKTHRSDLPNEEMQRMYALY